MIRVAALVSGLLTLSVAAALYFGTVSPDATRLIVLFNSLPWVTSTPAPTPRDAAPVPVSIAKAQIGDVPVYLTAIGAGRPITRSVCAAGSTARSRR
jgi:hypothetical protein